MGNWSPTPQLVHARVVRPFSADGSKLKLHLATLYPGEEVYIFETLDDTWARGYTIHNARPSDYSSAAVDVKRLPKRSTKVSVFPLACVKIIGNIELNEEDQFFSNESSSNIENTTGYEDTEDEDLNFGPGTDLASKKKHRRPIMPLANTSTSSHDLATEVKLTLNTISSSLFAVYSKGNFEFFDKLVLIFNELDDLRLSLISGILTKREEKMAKKKISFLMNKFSKLLASGGGLIDRTQYSKSDIDGKESIIARDEDTGELFSLGDDSNISSPALIAQSQALSALTPNFPWGQSGTPFVPPRNDKFEGTIPSNILVDFKQVVATSPVIPDGYAGMKAYMYLRNAKHRLTEAFSISVSSEQDLSLDNLAAAMFTNIPATAVNTDRIYLVALLTETIIDDATPHGKIEVHNELPVVRKGICAGVADISRIFSRRKGHLVSGQAHRFSIKLFSSYLDSNKQEVKLFHGMSSMVAKSMTMVNNGWGELVDRIISGSNRGVAINPRAEQLILSVKEVKLEPKNKEILDSISNSKNSALACIPMLAYNPLEKDSNRVFLRLIKASLTGVGFKSRSYTTIHVRGSSQAQLFAKGTNEPGLKKWLFLSTSPEEYVNELIVVKGFPDVPDSSNDFLIFDAYCNKSFVGSAQYLLRAGKVINDTGIFGKTTKSLDILSPDNIAKGTIEIDLEYVGKTYNKDKTVNHILDWKSYFGNDLCANEASFVESLGNVKRISPNIILGEFSEICQALLSALAEAAANDLRTIQSATFEALVLTLDIAVARNDEYVSIFDTMLERSGSKFPKVGEVLLTEMTKIFGNFDSEWTSVGRAICRVSILVLKISAKCFGNATAFHLQANEFFKVIDNFLGGDKDILISDQLLIIETLELYLEALQPWFNISELVKISVSWIKTNYLRGLGVLPDANSTPLINRKRAREHSYVINKLLLVNRLLNTFLVSSGTPSDREVLFNFALHFLFSVITSENIDLECSRLALGIILSVCRSSFGQYKTFYDESNQLYFSLIKCLPLFAGQFTRYHQFCYSEKLLKPKRTFTDLFPNCYPFNDYTMDSIVNDCIFAEVLVEFTVVISYIAKMFEFTAEEFFKWEEGGNAASMDFLESTFNIPKFSSHDAVTSMLAVSSDFITSEYYPKKIWLSLHLLTLETSYLISKLVEHYMPSPEKSNLLLWNMLLTNLFRLSTDKPISIEHLELTPKMASTLLVGDLRLKAAPLVSASWEKLGDCLSLEDKARFQVNAFSGFQKDIISLNDFKFLYYLFLFTMQRSRACLNVGNKVFWSIIASEVSEKSSLFDLEKESVSALYDLFERKHIYTPESTEINTFINSLQKIKGKMDPEDADIGEVNRLVKTFSHYLSSLSDLKRIPNGDEFDDDRTFHSLKISSYLLNVDKPELFQSFVNEMFNKNLEKLNFVQAALSLELLANTYEWDIDTYLPACESPKLPSQTAFKRKADLFKTIASNFIRGNKLEQAVDIYTEMLEAYMIINFDLNELSTCHTELGKLYGSLQTVDRLESTFFKISFIGFGFPESLRGKGFIYEGLPYEHITSINDRLNRLYPGSKAVSNDEEAAKFLKEPPPGKLLHIKTVTPKKKENLSGMSYMAKQYVENKNLNTFVTTRRLPGASSIVSLWTEETTYTTYMTFPTLMNRSEIKATKVVKVPPVKNAIRALSIKNSELTNLEYLLHQNLKNNISLEAIASTSTFNSLTRVLSGTVDSPVNGGAGEYKSFLNLPSDLEKGESDEEFSRDCQILSRSFTTLAYLLNNLLKLHGLIVPKNLKLQHEAMEKLFKKNFAFEIEESKLDVVTPLSYDQLMHSLTAVNIYSKQRHQQTEGSEATVNYFGSQLTRTSSHNTIGSTARRTPSIYSQNANHNHSHNSIGGRISSIFPHNKDGSSITVTEYSHGVDSLHTSSNSTSLKIGKRTNILNYK